MQKCFSGGAMKVLKHSNFSYYVSVLVVAALVFTASGFAANISSPPGNAGQGNTVTSGYVMGTVVYGGGWLVNGNGTNTNVNQFAFNLKKAADGTGVSTVTNENTAVWAQLLTESGGGNWAERVVAGTPVAGNTICNLSGPQQKPLAQVTGVNVVARDRNGDPTPPPMPVTVETAGAEVSTIDVNGEEYWLLQWNTSGTMTIYGGDLTGVEYLAVGGGGAGGNGFSEAGGGGGAGGLVTNIGEPVSLSSGGQEVIVGSGGVRYSGDGLPSQIPSLSVTAAGGGGGGALNTAGRAGGSGGGGGGSSSSTPMTGGAGTSGQGSHGGNGSASTATAAARNGGGGGGAGATGTNATGNTGCAPTGAGKGGDGIQNNITGSAVYYAGGGGGAATSNCTAAQVALGGLGGGGKGGAAGVSGENGTNGLGGGGGGARTGFGLVAGNGGSGTVIMRFPQQNVSVFSSFTPSSLSGVDLWLDASDAGTIAATDTSVVRWFDKSGNGRNFVQTTAGAQPRTGTRTQNGMNTIDFTRGQWLDGGDIMDLGLNSFAVFSVIKFDDTLGSAPYGKNVFGSEDGRYGLLRNAGTLSSIYDQNLGSTGSLGVADTSTDTRVITQQVVRNGANSQNILTLNTTVNTSTFTDVNTSWNITVPWRLGRYGTHTSFDFDGHIAEILVFLREVTPQEATAIQNYLNAKWGVY